MMKRLTISIAVILFCSSLLWSNAVYSATFIDKFDNETFTNANWTILFNNWDLTSDGYHGSAIPGSTAAAVAANGLSFLNNGLILETKLRVDYDDAVRCSGGIFFSLLDDGEGDYQGYDVSITFNKQEPPPIQFLLSVGYVNTSDHIALVRLPTVKFDTFYVLRIVIDDKIHIYLYDEPKANLLGSIENISPVFDHGMVGVHTVSETTYNYFSVSENPIQDEAPKAMPWVPLLLLDD